MTPSTLATRLLQTPGGLGDVSDAVNNGPSLPLGPVLAGLGLVLALVAARSIWRGPAAPAPGGEPAGPPAWRVGLAVCRARRVSWPGRLLLLRIARRTGLADPLPLLAASGTLYHHGRQYAAGLPAGRRQRVLRGVSRLQRELFAEADPEPPAPDAPAPSAAPPPDRRSRPRPLAA